jgi:hypothetical protein
VPRFANTGQQFVRLVACKAAFVVSWRQIRPVAPVLLVSTLKKVNRRDGPYCETGTTLCAVDVTGPMPAPVVVCVPEVVPSAPRFCTVVVDWSFTTKELSQFVVDEVVPDSSMVPGEVPAAMAP